VNLVYGVCQMDMLLNMMARVKIYVLFLVLSAAMASTATAAVVLTGDPPPGPEQRNSPPASLATPGADRDKVREKEKKCMTVCARWGEECAYINKGPGGTTKKCRRACKQFSQECF
jgi:hypothetical protein